MAANTKPVTLSEFKAWLEGVEELQTKAWVPDAKQWRLIRNKINNIIDNPAPAPATRLAPAPGVPTLPVAPALPMAPAPGPSALETVAPPAEMTDAARAALAGKMPAAMTPDASGKLTTPNVDSSDGNYDSAFE